MDMEAGLEHLAARTTSFMDSFIVVVEPGARSMQTYRKIRELALELGVWKISAVGNKVRGAEDEAFIRRNIPENELLGIIPLQRRRYRSGQKRKIAV
jgi:CO dehydrogenase maturation factor